MATYKIERGRRPGLPIGRISLIAVVLLLLLSARSIASYAVDIAWWRELGQFRTWLSMLYYGFAPVAIATLLAFGVLWLAHARAVKFAGTGLREHRIYFWISTLAPVRARLPDRGVGHRHLDGGALRGLARAAGIGNRLARRGVSEAALVLPLRPAVLPDAAQLRAGAGDLLHPGLLGGGAGLAAALPLSGHARGARDRPRPFSNWKAGSNRSSCAGRRWFCSWRWRRASFSAATKWFTTSTAHSWWASTGWIKRSGCRCSG